MRGWRLAHCGGRIQGPQISKKEATGSITLVGVTRRQSQSMTVPGAMWSGD